MSHSFQRPRKDRTARHGASGLAGATIASLLTVIAAASWLGQRYDPISTFEIRASPCCQVGPAVVDHARKNLSSEATHRRAVDVLSAEQPLPPPGVRKDVHNAISITFPADDHQRWVARISYRGESQFGHNLCRTMATQFAAGGIDSLQLESCSLADRLRQDMNASRIEIRNKAIATDHLAEQIVPLQKQLSNARIRHVRNQSLRNRDTPRPTADVASALRLADVLGERSNLLGELLQASAKANRAREELARVNRRIDQTEDVELEVKRTGGSSVMAPLALALGLLMVGGVSLARLYRPLPHARARQPLIRQMKAHQELDIPVISVVLAGPQDAPS